MKLILGAIDWAVAGVAVVLVLVAGAAAIGCIFGMCFAAARAAFKIWN